MNESAAQTFSEITLWASAVAGCWVKYGTP
jgi:hypothetical protein